MVTQPPFIPLEEGWSYMEIGITKLKRILEGEHEPEFTPSQIISLYTTIFNMCIQKSPHDYSQQLYDRYRKTIEDYCNQTVLPSLRMKRDEDMLKELALRWSNHKVMVFWLSRFFLYMERFFIPRRYYPTLNEVGLICFRDLVYNEMQSKATKAIIALIQKEREGEEIDRALLKNVLEIYVEVGMGKADKYVDDFETFMLQDTGAYYSRKASSWIQEYSFPQYMLKAEECLEEERERVTHYLHISTEPKLIKVSEEVFVFFSNNTVAVTSREVEKPSPEDLFGSMKI